MPATSSAADVATASPTLPASGQPLVSIAARSLWLLFLFNAVLLTATLSWFGAPEGETIVQPLRRFFLGYQQTDSWRPMAAAEQYLSAPHDRPVYQEMLDVRKVKFQYPLTSLLFTRPLNLEWLTIVSWFSVVAIVVSNWWILRRAGGGTSLEFRSDDPAVGLAIVGLTLSFYPVAVAYCSARSRRGSTACWHWRFSRGSGAARISRVSPWGWRA